MDDRNFEDPNYPSELDMLVSEEIFPHIHPSNFTSNTRITKHMPLRASRQTNILAQTLQQEYRRDMNRIHAKRSRHRKAMLQESLQRQLIELQNSNNQLKKVIRDRFSPSVANKIIADCSTNHNDSETGEASTISSLSQDKNENQNSTAESSQGTSTTEKNSNSSSIIQLNQQDFKLIKAIQQYQQNFILSDPNLPDNPITFCSDGFCNLVGYKRDEVLGRNCRFLQGPETDPNTISMLSKSLREGKDVSVCILNYKADGTKFWNQFFAAALRDADGKIINYVGVQCEVTNNVDK